jgi:hypothetical protein
MVKRVGFLPILLTIPAAAQSSSQHGMSVGHVQIAYLVDHAEATTPTSASLRLLDALQAASNGKTTTLAPSKPAPRAEFETWIEPEPRDYAESVLTGFSGIDRNAGKTVIRRFVRDNFRHVYVSYALTVETFPESGTFRVIFGDSDAAAPSDLPASADWKVVSPAKYPVPQILQDGETIALDLYSVTKTGQKLVEYIHVGMQTHMLLRQDAARDSYADDAEFNIAEPRLRVNGLTQDPAAHPDALQGLVLWVHVPGHGRFELSFKPNPGFEKAGEVAGNSLTFADGVNVFRIDCAERIAPAGSGIYNVYARRDPASEPADPKDRAGFAIGLAATAVR